MSKVLHIKNLSFALCIALIALFAACKKSALPQLNAIPGDAAFVVAIDNKQLYIKGQLNKLQDFKFFREIQREMAYMDDETRQFVENVMKNPGSLGIDLEKSYLFACEDRYDLFVAMVFKMKNVTAFENNVYRFLQNASGNNLDVKNHNNYKMVEDNDFAIAWNKNLLILGVNSYSFTSQFDKLFNLPAGNSILNNPDFVDFNNRSGDLGLWASYSSIIDLADSHVDMGDISALQEMAGMYSRVFLDFDKGELRLSFEMTPKSEMKHFFRKYPIVKRDFDKKLLSAIPEKSYLTLKQSVDLAAFMKMVGDIDSDYGDMLNDREVREIINGLGGDFILSLYGFAQGPLPIPLAGLAFNVNSENDFKNLLEMVPQNMISKKDGHYVINLLGMLNVSLYVAFKDNIVFLTDDIETVTAFTGKGVSKPMSASALSKTMYNFYINLDIDDYPANVQPVLHGYLGYSANEVLRTLRILKDFSLTVDNDLKVDVSLKFKDSRQNSLKQILEWIP